MLPRRCLPSWLGWQLHANGGGVFGWRGPGSGPADALGKGLAGARQGSCRGVAVVPGKALAGGLVDFLG